MRFWSANLMGTPRLVAPGGLVVAQPGLSMQLIGFLSTRRRMRASRTAIIAALWPDKDIAKARHCLATTIWRLRTQAGHSDPPLIADEETVELGPSLWLDTLAFDEHLRRGGGALEHKLRAALRLSGEFLEGHTAEWIAIERERLQCAAIDATMALAVCYAKRSNWEGAVTAARRVVRMEPLREDAHRFLMRAHIQSGNPALALRQYNECERIMASELGIEPMTETRAVVDNLVPASTTTRSGAGPEQLRATLMAGRAALASAAASLDHLIQFL